MTTQAAVVAGRLRQIRDRNQPQSQHRSAQRVARRIYAQASTIYIVSPNSFVAAFPDESVLVAGPAATNTPRGQAKTNLLSRVRQLPPERKHQPDALSDSRYYDIVQSICQKTAASQQTDDES